MLAASAGLVVGAGGTAALISGTADRASAAQAELQVSGHETTIRSGSIEAVWLDLTVAWQYALPSGEDPATAVVDLQAGEDLQTVAERSSDAVFLESSGEEAFEVDLLAEEVLSAETIRPDTGGETVETVVDVGVSFSVESAGGAVLAVDEETTTATLSITESEYDASEHGDVVGSGELTIELG